MLPWPLSPHLIVTPSTLQKSLFVFNKLMMSRRFASKTTLMNDEVMPHRSSLCLLRRLQLWFQRLLIIDACEGVGCVKYEAWIHSR
jgi:hypothetical protein